MGAFFRDLRFAIRILLKHPGTTAVAVLSLAIGIGANFAIFSIVDAFYLRPLPVAHPSKLVTIGWRTPQGADYGCSYPDFLDLHNQNAVFTDVMAYGDRGAFIKGDQMDGLASVAVVSENYFSVLGVKAAAGRTFNPTLKSSEEGEPSALVSYAAWQEYFGGSSEIIGKTILIDGKGVSLIGVAPPEFRGMDRESSTDLWVTPHTWSVMHAGARDDFESRGSRWLALVGRVKSGVDRMEIAAQLKLLSQRLATAYPATNKDQEFTSQTEAERVREAMPRSAFILAMVGLVLLIACANVVNLSLTQQEGRRREIAVRLAMGATRGQLLKQSLTEGLLLTALGGSAGLLLTHWLIQLVPTLVPPAYLSSIPDIQIDTRVVVFTALASLLTALIFGVVPGLKASRCDVAPILKGDSAASTGRLRFLSLKNTLTMGEIALSVVLLIGAGLLIKSLLLTLRIRPGFDPQRNVLMVDVGVPEFYGYHQEQAMALFERIVQHIREVPGVIQASFARRPLLTDSEGGETENVVIPGAAPPAAKKGVRIRYNIVGLNFFSTMGTRILHGRDFGTRDSPTSTSSIIINETMAKRFWDDSVPVGQWVHIGKKDYQIIGIAEDGRYLQIHERAQPYLFFPFTQRFSYEATLFIETAGDPRSNSVGILREARRAAGEVPLVEARTLHDHMRMALFQD